MEAFQNFVSALYGYELARDRLGEEMSRPTQIAANMALVSAHDAFKAAVLEVLKDARPPTGEEREKP